MEANASTQLLLPLLRWVEWRRECLWSGFLLTIEDVNPMPCNVKTKDLIII
jgi:hypothetical protein